MRNPVIVTANPDRPNIKYLVVRVKDDPFVTFKWLVEELWEKGTQAPRTIIYCRRVKDCAYIYRTLQLSLPERYSYYPPECARVSENRLYAMFHQSTEQKIKDTVISSFSKPDGVCRVVIATVALGMGMDFRDIRRVINYGPPNSIEQYLQQCGRAGRDQQQSIAAIVWHGRQMKTCDSDMKTFVLDKYACRRQFLLQYFGWSSEALVPEHICCDICAARCSCSAIHQLPMEPSIHDQEELRLCMKRWKRFCSWILLFKKETDIHLQSVADARRMWSSS